VQRQIEEAAAKAATLVVGMDEERKGRLGGTVGNGERHDFPPMHGNPALGVREE
jgi:hypothetical protein